MHNRDLIAFLKPITSQFSVTGDVELLDITGQVTDIEANGHRLSLRLTLPAGLYRGRLKTKPHSFDMATASIEMVRVPDGKRVPIGPWDLDHLHNVMAMPMARVYGNGLLKGGLWFAMPGPDEIKQGCLSAEFGFEVERATTELVLDLIERDRERLDWGQLEFLELRKDDRRTFPLLPMSAQKPRLFVSAAEVPDVLNRWKETNRLAELCEQLRTEELVLLTDNSQGTLSLAMIFYTLTSDEVVGARARAAVMELAHAATWSGRPDPLLMGGENDRGISLRLFHIALAWDHLQPLLSDADRQVLLSKADEYLRKIYDFTLLQRAYMGCPAIDPHSLGSWNGPATACMAFYEELEIARHALPLFHGLFCDSLTLFPASGKAAWATYFPFHLVLYLAAAHTFGGRRQELSSSAFLDNLGNALLGCFEAPNSQELQRGLRTREHRFLTAFLSHFHPTAGVDEIYRSFAERERQATGGLSLGIFDLLYAPQADGPRAKFPDRPFFARDVGDVIAIARGEKTVALSIAGGAKAGRLSSFMLKPQNREFAPSLGAFELAVDGAPVICNVNISSYGIDSALTNTMCFEQGGGVTNGQYLNGAVRPEQGSVIRRCLIGDRYMYAHIVITAGLDPALEIHQADRIFIFDRKTGSVLLSDAFRGERALRFATHLHCSGGIYDQGGNLYRLIGGQANLIAGIKRGDKGLDDVERGEIFVQVLQTNPTARVVVTEPSWIPGYIYGLNYTGREELKDGRFPHYQRWRLEAEEPTRQGAFLVSLSPHPGQVRLEPEGIALMEGGLAICKGRRTALGVECDCECVLWDDATECITAIGLTRLQHAGMRLAFASSVDLEYCALTGEGTAYSQSTREPEDCDGFILEQWQSTGEESWRTHCAFRASFKKAV
jgi:hypothetical protein